MRLKKIALSAAASLLVLVGAVTFLPLRAIAGLETPCNYISDLVSTNPLSSDLASTSDDHHRCIKSVLKTTFPNVNAAVTSTDEELNIVDGVTSTAAELNLLDGITGTVWSSGNDGAGSGLDADLLDGSSSAAFAQLAATTNTFTGTTLELQGASSRILLDETDATTDERHWRWAQSAGQLLLGTRNDADNGGNEAITIDRTGTTVTSIALTASALSASGQTTFTGTGALGSIVVSTTAPIMGIRETDASADNGRWRWYADNEGMNFPCAINDALASENCAISFARTGTTVDSINLQATQVYVPDGAAAAPGVSFSADTNTGIFRSGADNLAFVTGGVNRLNMDTSAVYIGSGTSNVPMAIPDGVTAPSTVVGLAFIYVDTSDGDLKVKFGDGTVKTITTDSP